MTWNPLVMATLEASRFYKVVWSRMHCRYYGRISGASNFWVGQLYGLQVQGAQQKGDTTWGTLLVLHSP